MAANTYWHLGANKRLSDLVFAGSHDAAITSGAGNVQTQNLSIRKQASAGVRLFDLRILAHSEKSHGKKSATLKAYHGLHSDTSKRKRELSDLNYGPKQKITTSKMRTGGGSFGLGLADMLNEAKGFVEKYDTEFLILKFDKCTNWGVIAQYCVEILGDKIYTHSGNLNQKTLQQLRGKVVIIFSKPGVDAARYLPSSGILGFKNLYSGGAYDPNFNGLQYHGKGGTAIFRPDPRGNKGSFSTSAKIDENITTQKRIMQDVAVGGGVNNTNVIGLMYWTTTAAQGSILKRNNKMWTGAGIQKMKALFQSGLTESIKSRTTHNHYEAIPTGFANGMMLRAFLPNFIMIDFADSPKCDEIISLNTLANTALEAGYKNAIDDGVVFN